MNVHDARLAVLDIVKDVLLDLADDGEMGDAEFLELEAAMADAAEMIVDALGMTITEVVDESRRELVVTLEMGAVAANI